MKRLSSHALRFVMQNGVVTHVSPSVKSTQTDVLNIQRGILSMIQVRQVKDEMLEVTEVCLFCFQFSFSDRTSFKYISIITHLETFLSF